MAGVGIAMTDHAQLDVGYRFLDLGTVSGFSGVTGTSVSQRVFVNPENAPLGANIVQGIDILWD